MIRLRNILVLAILSASAVVSLASQSLDLKQLNDALTSVPSFQLGDNSRPLEYIEQTVFAVSANPGESRQVEQRLLITLSSTRTRDGKIFLCRQLRTIGSDACIPKLEAMLLDADVSHAARYALGSIDSDAAKAAMLRAMRKAAPALQVGMANTLGLKRYAEATNELARFLESNDPSLAAAGAKALGRIGRPAAALALQKARPGAPRSVQSSIDEALIVCADNMTAEGKTAAAERIYKDYYTPDKPSHIRLAALRGLVLTQGPRGMATLVEAVKSSDQDVRKGAIGLMTVVEGRAATRAFTDLLGSLEPDSQEMLIRALGDRGHGEAEGAIIEAMSSGNEQVRIAAAEALGKIGGLQSVTPLAKMAANGSNEEKSVARASLARINTPGINAKLLASMNDDDPAVRAEIIRAAGEREMPAAMVKLRRAARDDSETVRREAIRALGRMAEGPAQLRNLLDMAVEPKDPGDRPTIELAIVDAFARITDPAEQAQPVLTVLRRAPNEAKPILLRLLTRPATRQALEAVRNAQKDRDPVVSDAAVRALADWPNTAAADDLLAIAGQSSNPTQRVLALRGYIRMAGMSDNPTSMYIRAMNLAERPEDKKLVLAGLGGADSLEALAIVEAYLGNPQLKAEAALATVQIAERLRESHPAQAKAALKKVTASIGNSPTRDKAQSIINEMEQYEGHILKWVGAGPYTKRPRLGAELFDIAFDPENAGSTVTWTAPKRGVGEWKIDLAAAFGVRNNAAIYLQTTVVSPVEQDARLELGSDDAIKVWLNGQYVHGKNTSRSVSPRQDIVNIKLKKGSNTLMLKIINYSGPWEVACRIRKPDGADLSGLQFNPPSPEPRQPRQQPRRTR